MRADTLKAPKMPFWDRMLCYMLIILWSSTVIFSFLAILPWTDLQEDKLDYEDERLAFLRAMYPCGIPSRHTWKQFQRGEPGYIRWYKGY